MTDADGLAQVAPGDHSIVIVQFERARIEANDTADALERLRGLSEDPAKARGFADSMAVQVAGYDDDPRELYEISEVRAYFSKLTDAWPYWLHFLLKGRDFDQVDLVLRLLATTHSLARTAGAVATLPPNPLELAPVVGRLLNAAIDLQERHEHSPLLRRTFVARVRAASQYLS